MNEQYHLELNQLRLTEESKTALITALSKHAPAPRPSPKTWRYAIAVAAVVCILVLSVGAITLSPILGEYYENSPGYQQSSIALGDSITKDGWTMTLTDCVADEYNLYMGVELTAPEGTVLDREDGYHFADFDYRIWGLDPGGGGGYKQIADDDPTDNSIRFIFRYTYSMRENQRLDGRRITLRFGELYHNTRWNEQAHGFDKSFDCKESWSFTSRLSLSDDTILIEPNLPVTTLDVEAVITRVEVTPIGVYVYIEGDSLKGHHDWVPMNAPDGWYGCVEYQDITLHLTDGTALAMTEGMEGSGCSGGTDTSEPGYLHLARRADTLLDMGTLDYITVCGVDIPLR